MSIPPNQFRRDHPWTRFVLLDSSAGPVPSQTKVTHSLTLSLKKNPTVNLAPNFHSISKIRWHGFARPVSHLVNCQRTRREREGIAKTRC